MTPQAALLAGLTLAALGYVVLLYLLIELRVIMGRRGNTIGAILVETLIFGKLLLFALAAVSLYKELEHLAAMPVSVQWTLIVAGTAFPWLTVVRCLAWRRENRS
jgi:hypothetical protein